MINIFLTILSSYLIYSNNQIVIVAIIILSCTLLSSYIFLVSNIHWFSLLMILIYISGVIVLFIFIVSLTPNENSPININPNIIFIVGILTLMSMNSIFYSENLNINSSIEWSIIPITLISLVIIIIAYLPPNIINSFYSGINSTN